MKKGQIWVETVVYTLIALVMIGLILGVARPRIEELQDNAIIDQSVGMLKNLDSNILTMGGTGNQRVIEIGIRKGTLKIDGPNDKIIFEIESRSTYSEPETDVYDGNIKINTIKQGNLNKVTLTLDYIEDYDITYEGADEERLISKASTSYKLLAANKGDADLNGKINIDFELI